MVEEVPAREAEGERKIFVKPDTMVGTVMSASQGLFWGLWADFICTCHSITLAIEDVSLSTTGE